MIPKLHSISTAIFVGISLALAISFGLASWYTTTVRRDEMYAAFERQRLDLTEHIAAEMVEPIYSFSPNNGSLALAIVKRDTHIAAVEVYDSLNEMEFIRYSIPDRMVGELFENESPVVREGEIIGHVKVTFSDGGLTRDLEEKNFMIQKIFGVTFLATLLILFPLLYFKIFGPLRRLADQAHHFQQNDLERQVIWKGRDEMNLVGQAFEQARVSMLELIGKLRDSNAELKRVSETDRLTGLFNRHRLDEVLQSEKRRCERYGGTFGLILIDVDHFKQVNDTHGHQIGDSILKQFANLLSKHSRETDIVGRWGGEEFMIICPEADREGVRYHAEGLRMAVEAHAFKHVATKTASFGAAVYSNGESIKDLVAKTDAALYKAKEGGRNKVEYL